MIQMFLSVFHTLGTVISGCSSWQPFNLHFSPSPIHLFRTILLTSYSKLFCMDTLESDTLHRPWYKCFCLWYRIAAVDNRLTFISTDHQFTYFGIILLTSYSILFCMDRLLLTVTRTQHTGMILMFLSVIMIKCYWVAAVDNHLTLISTDHRFTYFTGE